MNIEAEVIISYLRHTSAELSSKCQFPVQSITVSIYVHCKSNIGFTPMSQHDKTPLPSEMHGRCWLCGTEQCFTVVEGHSRGPRMGSLKSPCKTSYRLSIETIVLNVFQATDNQTNRQTDRTSPSHKPDGTDRWICLKAYSKYNAESQLQRSDVI